MTLTLAPVILPFFIPFYTKALAYRPPKTPLFLGLGSAVAVVLALFWIWSQLGYHPLQEKLALTHVRLTDKLQWKVSKPRTLLIKGNLIWSILPEKDPIPQGYRVIDSSGLSVMPGLIDLGVFLSLEGRLPGDSRPVPPFQALEQHLRAGVSTVLDLNSSRTMQRNFKRQQALLQLPTVLFAGPLYTGIDGWRPPGRTPWENNLVELSAVSEIDNAWRGHITFNYDLCFVSLEHPGRGHAAMNRRVLLALAQRARQRKIPLIIHATTVEKMLLAAQARPQLMVGSPRNQIMDAKLLQAMKESKTAWAPALGEVLNLWPYRKIRPELKTYDRVGALPLKTKNSLLKIYYRKRWIRPHNLDGTQLDLMLANVRHAYTAGIPIVAASLAGLPGVTHGRGLHQEMDWLAKAGLPASATLKAATNGAAKAVGLKDRGRIRPGWRADLVLVEGDPTVDAQAHLNIRGMVHGGKYIKPADTHE